MKPKFKIAIISITILFGFLFSCQQPATPKEEPEMNWKEPKTSAYQFKNMQEWLLDSNMTSAAKAIVFAVNRTDSLHFSKMDSVVVPVDLSGDIVYYLPFPLEVSDLKEIDKIVFFSYATQTFAAYELGQLVYTGPTNMGREKDQTPTGLFFTNWKAKTTISTVNDEWELKWNFNIANKAGIGWHEYSLPGYPASHSCLRLCEKDAKFLYNWAKQWELQDKNTISVKGTPVIVFGTYDFSKDKPWWKLIQNPHALDISENELKELTLPHINEILANQTKRKAFQTELNE